jgi:hypothetical protein
MPTPPFGVGNGLLPENTIKIGFEFGFVPRVFVDSKRHSSFVPEKNSTKNENIPPTLILKDIPVSFLKKVGFVPRSAVTRQTLSRRVAKAQKAEIATP